MQDALGRADPRSRIRRAYLRFRHSTIAEPEFLAALVGRTGCGVLCDVNNVFVTAHNLGLDPAPIWTRCRRMRWGRSTWPATAVNDADGRAILIDDHGSPVAAPVWALYAQAARPVRRGARH